MLPRSSDGVELSAPVVEQCATFPPAKHISRGRRSSIAFRKTFADVAVFNHQTALPEASCDSQQSSNDSDGDDAPPPANSRKKQVSRRRAILSDDEDGDETKKSVAEEESLSEAEEGSAPSGDELSQHSSDASTGESLRDSNCEEEDEASDDNDESDDSFIVPDDYSSADERESLATHYSPHPRSTPLRKSIKSPLLILSSPEEVLSSPELSPSSLYREPAYKPVVERKIVKPPAAKKAWSPPASPASPDFSTWQGAAPKTPAIYATPKTPNLTAALKFFAKNREMLAAEWFSIYIIL